MLSYKTWDVVCFISCCRSNFLISPSDNITVVLWKWPPVTRFMNAVDLFSVGLKRDKCGGARRKPLGSCANFSELTWRRHRRQDPADIDICSGEGGGCVTSHHIIIHWPRKSGENIKIMESVLNKILDDSVHWRMFAVICAQFGTLL